MIIFAFYVAPGNWRDKAIRFVTGDRESHVEYLTVPVVKTANATVAASKRDGSRVRAEIIHWKPDHWEFVQVPVKAAPVHRRIISEVGRPYDTWGALTYWAPFGGGRRDAWFCSELMAHAMSLPEPHRYTPGSFRRALMLLGGVERIIDIPKFTPRLEDTK